MVVSHAIELDWMPELAAKIRVVKTINPDPKIGRA
jgi:hypothetical protein